MKNSLQPDCQLPSCEQAEQISCSAEPISCSSSCPTSAEQQLPQLSRLLATAARCDRSMSTRCQQLICRHLDRGGGASASAPPCADLLVSSTSAPHEPPGPVERKCEWRAVGAGGGVFGAQQCGACGKRFERATALAAHQKHVHVARTWRHVADTYGRRGGCSAVNSDSSWKGPGRAEAQYECRHVCLQERPHGGASVVHGDFKGTLMCGGCAAGCECDKAELHRHHADLTSRNDPAVSCGDVTGALATSSSCPEERSQWWRCLPCGIMFPKESLWVLHNACHAPGNPWQCQLCGEQSANVYEFSAHLTSAAHCLPH